MSKASHPLLVLYLATSLVSSCSAQASKSTSSSGSSNSLQQGLELAKSGHCQQAIPLLRKTLSLSADRNLKRDAGLAGVHCAMVENRSDSAEEFLRILNRDLPDDPEVLYASVHTYSDLATRASQRLANSAPNSAQAHELNAESLEMQGKWDEAEKEYRGIAAQNPRLPGIHFRIGRLLLSKPNPPATAAEEARREFNQELAIDPSNAGAEYVLGELARQDQSWDEAIAHFSKAAKLDPQFGEAFFELGIAFISLKRYSDAVPPLETAVKIDPRNPDAHYQLATAYTRAGRKQDGEKEFAIHRQLIKTQGGAVE